jgi:hypothetical protein
MFEVHFRNSGSDVACSAKYVTVQNFIGKKVKVEGKVVSVLLTEHHAMEAY